MSVKTGTEPYVAPPSSFIAHLPHRGRQIKQSLLHLITATPTATETEPTATVVVAIVVVVGGGGGGGGVLGSRADLKGRLHGGLHGLRERRPGTLQAGPRQRGILLCVCVSVGRIGRPALRQPGASSLLLILSHLGPVCVKRRRKGGGGGGGEERSRKGESGGSLSGHAVRSCALAGLVGIV